MSNILLVSIIIAAAASIGGIIALYTKEEMKQYKKEINFAEIILSIIPLFLIFLIRRGFFPVLFLIIGALTIITLKKSIYHDLFDKYLKAIIFGVMLGVLLSFQIKTAFIFGIFVGLHNIVKGSKIGSYYISRNVNIFKKIGNFQALFVISALIGFYLLSFPVINIFTLYFSVGAIIILAFNNEI